MNEALTLFAYGSLMAERVCPEHIEHEELVILRGFERAFHKVSWVRGCHPDDAVLDVQNVGDRFREPERNLSLVLGLRPQKDSHVFGFLQTYGSDVALEVLEKLDAREGFDPKRPVQELAYLRRPCVVEDAAGRRVKALTYFTNPTSDMILDTLSIEEQAAILAAATSKPVEGGISRGLFYLEGVRCALRDHQRLDQNLEALSGCAYKWYQGKLHFLSPEL